MDSSMTYSAADTARILGFSKSGLLKAVREGRAGHLCPVHIGNRTRFPKNVIDRLACPEVA